MAEDRAVFVVHFPKRKASLGKDAKAAAAKIADAARFYPLYVLTLVARVESEKKAVVALAARRIAALKKALLKSHGVPAAAVAFAIKSGPAAEHIDVLFGPPEGD